jgi:beta-aspartyl-peptidase (threonine type)
VTDFAPSRPWSLVIHAGAGGPATDATTDSRAELHEGLRVAYDCGEAELARGGSALDAVCAAVRALEDNPAFNAGRGSVLTEDGTVEMDAAVMTGDGRAGAVAGCRQARNPVELARAIREYSPHVFLIDPDPVLLEQWGIEMADPEWFITPARREQLARIKARRAAAPEHGTVGAAALDWDGHLAAATSTGGVPRQLAGRIGDSPIIGAGTYARDGVVAVSCTGHGEAFIEGVVAHDVYARMAHGGSGLAAAAQATLKAEILARNAVGALIAVDAFGRVVVSRNSATLLSAWRDGDQVVTHVGGQ